MNSQLRQRAILKPLKNIRVESDTAPQIGQGTVTFASTGVSIFVSLSLSDFCFQSAASLPRNQEGLANGQL